MYLHPTLGDRVHHTYVLAYIHTHTHTSILKHACVFVYACLFVCMYAHKGKPIYFTTHKKYAYAHTHTKTHSYTHTHKQYTHVEIVNYII